MNGDGEDTGMESGAAYRREALLQQEQNTAEMSREERFLLAMRAAETKYVKELKDQVFFWKVCTILMTACCIGIALIAKMK